jgi:periplasmic copper chaperone A
MSSSYFKHVVCMAALGLASLAIPGPASAAEHDLVVSKAWTPVTDRGANAPLSMTVTNEGEADLLLRARCDAANFFEQHTVDHGEGFPAMRVIKAIPIAAHATTKLNPDGYHVMLLQATHPLAAGETFSCTVTFRDAGPQDVTVRVGSEN